MTRLLLHICCGPCAAFPVKALRDEGHDILGLFHNPNIHPYSEYLRRGRALQAYQPELGIDVEYAAAYHPEEYFREVSYHEVDRCRHCYEIRLRAAARSAKRHGCEAFTTTLLYSVYQKHDLLRRVGERIADEEDLHFLYRDFRTGWQAGCDRYRESGLYRQNYCGCLFSEQERLEKKKGAGR